MDERRDRLKFYCITELDRPARELIREKDGLTYQKALPLPLPGQLVIFALGSWKAFKDDATVDVKMISEDGSETVNLGKLDSACRCLCWEGNWTERFLKVNKRSQGKRGTAVITLNIIDQCSMNGADPKSEQSVMATNTDVEMSEPVAVKTTIEPKKSSPAEAILKPQGEKKRARMMADKMPEGSTPRKRKPSTRARSIRDMFNSISPTSNGKENCEQEAPEPKSKENIVKETKPAEVQKVADKPSEHSHNTTSASLRTVKPEGRNPSARWGHTLCMISEGEAVLIGGQGEKQQLSKDSCWLLNIGSQHWRAPDTSAQGPKPESRMGHTAVYDPTVRCIYVFGGSKNKRWFNDVHVLDVDNWKWQAVKANGKAPTRSYHSMVLYRHELWCFGGVFPQPDPQPDGSSNDIHVFTPIEESWYMPIVMGEKPLPRSGHSATLLEDKMVVFGGWDYPTVFNDLHVLDLGIVEWSQPSVSGIPPSPRSWHAACAVSGKRVIIHGGYDGNVALNDSFIFNLDTLMWTEVLLDIPIAIRAGHAALCLPYKHTNDNNDEVLIFGGGDNEDVFNNDLHDILVPIQANESSSNVLADVNN